MKKFALISVLALSAPMTHAAAFADSETFNVWAWIESFFSDSDDNQATTQQSNVIAVVSSNIDTSINLIR